MSQTIVTDRIKRLVARHDSALNYFGSLLVGSHARAKHNWYSDLDLLFISRDEPEKENRYRLLYDHELLVSLSVCSLGDLEAIFVDPCLIVGKLQGLRNAQILRDRDDKILAGLKQRAINFKWTDELKAQANREAVYILRGNAEEVHKTLGGLEEKNKHAMLQGAWGIVLAMPQVLALHFGILAEGDSSLAEQVLNKTGRTSLWSHYYSLATGEVPSCKKSLSPLATQSIFSVLLYNETARILKDVIESSFNDKEFFDIVLAKIDDVPTVKSAAMSE